MKRVFKWIRYIRCGWYRNHPLGLKYFITNKKGVPKYCYKCGNFSNYVIVKYKIFRVPICRKHYHQHINS